MPLDLFKDKETSREQAGPVDLFAPEEQPQMSSNDNAKLVIDEFIGGSVPVVGPWLQRAVDYAEGLDKYLAGDADSIDAGQKVAQEERQARREARPVVGAAAEAVGSAAGLAVPIAAAPRAFGVAGTGTRTARALRGGATLGGVTAAQSASRQLAETGQVDPKKTAMEAVGGAIGGSISPSVDDLVGAGLRGVGRIIPGVQRQTPDVPRTMQQFEEAGTIRRQELQAAMQQAYQRVDDAGIEINPDAVNSLTGRLARTFSRRGPNELRPETDAPVIDLLSEVQEMIGRRREVRTVATDPVRGTIRRRVPVTEAPTFSDIDQAARRITARAANMTGEQRRKAFMIRDNIEQWLDDITPDMTNASGGQFNMVRGSLERGREARRAITRTDEINTVINNTIDSLNSNFTMKDLTGTLRRNIKSLDKRLRVGSPSYDSSLANNFSAAERSAIHRMTRPNALEKITERLGRAAFTLSKIDALIMMTGIFGSLSGHPLAMIVTAGQIAAHIPRQIANRIFTGRLASIQRMAGGGAESVAGQTPAAVAAASRGLAGTAGTGFFEQEQTLRPPRQRLNPFGTPMMPVQ